MSDRPDKSAERPARSSAEGDAKSIDKALRRVRRAYAGAHAVAALRGIGVAGICIVLAVGLHQMSSASWLVGVALAGSLGVLAWRGGAWRRGAFAGVIAGLPPLLAPSIVFAIQGQHCSSCASTPMWPCVVACFGTGSLVGILVGYRAITDRSPRRYAIGALATAALTGLLGCGTTGLGGTLGVVIGLAAGGITGWLVAGKTAHA
jgi:hypothetical protein